MDQASGSGRGRTSLQSARRVRARRRERCAAGRRQGCCPPTGESEGAVDGKKRTVRGVARRAAKPSKEAGKGGDARSTMVCASATTFNALISAPPSRWLVPSSWRRSSSRRGPTRRRIRARGSSSRRSRRPSRASAAEMAWLAPRAELALPQELAEDFLTTVLDAAHTEYLFIYVFSDQISDVCQTSDPV